MFGGGDHLESWKRRLVAWSTAAYRSEGTWSRYVLTNLVAPDRLYEPLYDDVRAALWRIRWEAIPR